MATSSTLTISRKLRIAIRAALASHPDWQDWRKANLGDGRSMADMNRDETIKACRDLGVDFNALAASTPFPDGPDTDDESNATMNEPAPMDPDWQAWRDAGNGESRVPTPFEGQDPIALVQGALAGVADFLSSKMVAQLEASIAPLAQAASQGPRVETRVETREVVKTVTVDETGHAVAAPVPPVALVDMREGAKVFSKALKTRGATKFGALTIPVCDGIAGEGDVPMHDVTYVWQGDMLGYLVAVAHLAASNDASKRRRASALLYGPAGTGKTSAVECFAAACGRPFFRIAIDRNTEGLELVGQRLPVPGGGTMFHEGALVTAMQVPYAVILIDEPSFLRPGTAAVLQTILDKRYTILKEDKNRRVEFAEGVMVVLADNTNLCGDETGRYADTIAQNVALQDRIGFFVPVDYLPPHLEAKSLSTHSGLALEACERMVTYAGLTRHGRDNGTLTTGTSYRRLLAWADAITLGAPSQSAFNASIINPADPADRPTLTALESGNLRHSEIDALAQGGTVAAPVVEGSASRPQNIDAANAFETVPNVSFTPASPIV